MRLVLWQFAWIYLPWVKLKPKSINFRGPLSDTNLLHINLFIHGETMRFINSSRVFKTLQNSQSLSAIYSYSDLYHARSVVTESKICNLNFCIIKLHFLLL